MNTLGKISTDTRSAKIGFVPETVSPRQYLPL